MSGDWNMTSTWVGGVIPGAGQDVIISTGHVVTLSDTRTCDDITINSGGTLSLNSGGNFTPTGIFTTIGILNLAGAVVPATQAFVVNGTCTISQPYSFQNPGGFSGTGTVVINSGLTLTGNYSFPNVNQTSGIINGASMVTINGNYTFAAGNMNITGNLSVLGTMNCSGGNFGFFFSTPEKITVEGLTTISNNTSFNFDTIVLNGGMSWIDGSIELNNAAKMIVPAGQQLLYTIANSRSIGTGGGVIGTLQMNGTFIKQGAFQVDVACHLTHTGSMDIQGGTIQMREGGGTLSGSINIGAGSTFKFINGGSYTLTGPVTGTGLFSVHGVSLTITGNQTFHNLTQLSGSISGATDITVLNNFNFNAGLFNTIGSLTVNGALNWAGGTFGAFANPSDTIFVAGLTTISGSVTVHRFILLLNGGCSWMDGNIELNNLSKMVLPSGQQLICTIPSQRSVFAGTNDGSFQNDGTFIKQGSQIVIMSVSFAHNGSLDIQNGTFRFQGGTSNLIGSINLAASGQLQFTGGNYSLTGPVTGTGTISLGGATLTVIGDHTFPNFTHNNASGTLNGTGNITVTGNYNFSQGLINNIGNLTIGGTLTWDGGLIGLNGSSTGIVTVAGLATITAGSGGPAIRGKTLNLNGGGIWTDGIIDIQNNGKLVIGSGQTYTVNLPGLARIISSDNTGIIENFGILVKNNASTTLETSPALTNKSSGTLKGLGTLTFPNLPFTNQGTIAPGLSPGILNMAKFSAAGTVEIEVAGTAGAGLPGGHDQLNLTALPITLGGNLNIAVTNGFVPVPGNSFTILTLPSGYTGTFASVTPCWAVAYNPTNVIITYTPVSFASCPSDINLNNNLGICSGVVTYSVDPTGVPAPVFSFQFSGATTATGSGTGSGSAFNVGLTTVNIFANNGCSGDTCSFSITINDVDVPSITCPPNVTVNTSPGICTASSVALGSPTASDNCGIASTTNNALSTYPIGVTNVTWTVMDVNGLVSTCIQTVSVVDNEAPLFITCPDNLVVETTSGNCSAPVSFTASASDNCGVLGITYAPFQSGEQLPVGTTIETITATDIHGNTSTCSFTITVADTEAPVITCPTSILLATNPGVCTRVVNFTISANDNCAVSSILSVPPSGSAFPVGTNTVNVTVTDIHGNTATCAFSVIITDEEAPVINCPAMVTVGTDIGLCSASNVALGAPFTNDNCGIETIVNTAIAVYPKGNTNVTWTVMDVHGLVASCIQTVMVVDNQPPAIVCPADLTVYVNGGQSVQVNYNLPAISDNCPGTFLVQLAGLPSGSNFPIGTTLNTFQATDASGLTSTCSFSVYVKVGKVGINTINPFAILQVADSSVLFSGTIPIPNQPAPPPVSGPGVRMMWYPQKGAFRTGAAIGTEWNKDSIGIFSFAAGSEVRASGDYSMAMGLANISSGQSAMSLGSYNEATGTQSLAMGALTHATGNVSTSMGVATYASGTRSTAMGFGTHASGAESIAMGDNTYALGNASSASGKETFANSYACHVVGIYNDTTLASRSGWVGNDPVFMIGNGFNAGTRSNAMTALKNGNIGTGTISPTHKLHVVNNDPGDGGYTNSLFIENINSSVGEAALSLKNKSVLSSEQWILGLNQAPYLSFGYGTSFTGPLTHMLIDTFGRMGLNTVSPQASVHVVKNNPSGGPFNSNSLVIYESDQSSDIQLSNKTVNASAILSGNQQTSIRSGVRFEADSSVQILSGGNTPRIVVRNNGNVGIGTIAAATKLAVSGSSKLGIHGSVFTGMIKTTINFDLPNILANTTYDAGFAVTNAVVGSTVYISPGALLNPGLIIGSARVSAPDMVEVRFINVGSTTNPPAMDFYIGIIQ